MTVTCAAIQITLLQTDQCTATVVNETSTVVTWTISPTGTGSITQNGGLYTAPATFPSNNQNVVTVTATSTVQTSLTGTATITIEQPTQINAVTCVDPVTGVQPSPLTVSSGNQLDCSATSSTGALVPVTWAVTNANKPGGNIGSISSPGGTYTAPLVPPPGEAVAITATSTALSTESMSVTATVVFGNNVISGPYAFSTAGRVTNNSNAFFARVGSFTAGGGTLSGIEDTNQSGASGSVKTQQTFNGSYSIGPDGRGTMQFCEGNSGPSCPAGSQAATAYFRVVVVSPGQAELIEFSSPGTDTSLTTARGEFISQDQAVFGAGNQALSGTYSFNFSGISSTSTFESVVGEFTSNGFGTIDAGSNTTPGELDLDGGGAQTISGTQYVISSNGRGAGVSNASPFTLGGLSFSFYMVSASHAKFIEIDPSSSILVGDAYKQQASATCGWGLNTLSNSVVLETEGTSSGVEVQDVGSFTASVSGGTGVVSTGSLDENNGGAVTSQLGTLAGSYAVDSCGRGTLSIGSHDYVFYPISTSNALVQEITSGTVAHGFLTQSQGGPFADASLTGSYAVNFSGTDAPGASGNRIDILGQFTSAGSGSGVSGSLDINDFGATQTGVAIANATYTADPAQSLRGTAALTATRNLVLYLVSPTLFYVLETDATGTAIGAIYNQF